MSISAILPAADRERHDRERLSVERTDQPRRAVDERREPVQTEAREALSATSHLLRAADLDRGPHPAIVGRRTTSGSSTATSLGKSPSCAAARKASTTLRSAATSASGVPCRSWTGDARGSPAGAPHPGRARRWARSPRRASEDVVQHERDALGRRQRLEHHEQRKADRVGQQRAVLRAHSVSAVDDGSGT